MTDDSAGAPKSNPLIEAALDYRERGWRPIQLHGINQRTGVGCTCRKGPECRSAGKHPVEDAWQQASPMDEVDIVQAWSGWRSNHNVGIATGDESGFWVLDIDPENGGRESAARLAAEHSDTFGSTISVVTGSGGWHYYFLMPDFPVTNARGRLKDYPGIDVRGNGGQVVAPPSVTDKGAYRRAQRSGSEIGPAPEWLLDMIRPVEPTTPVLPATAYIAPAGTDPRLSSYAAKAWDGEVARLEKMAASKADSVESYVGEPWNATTFEVACNLLELANATWTPYTANDAYTAVIGKAPRDSGFTDEDVNIRFKSAVERVGDKARSAPAPRAETEDVFGWDIFDNVPKSSTGGESVPVKDWPMRSRDDQGNAERMVDHFGDRLRYIAQIKGWALYDGGRWAQVDATTVQGMVMRLFKSNGGILARTEALQYDDTPGVDGNGDPTPSERDKFMGWIGKQRMAARIAAAVTLTSSSPALAATLDDFDADPLLLNVSNGVVKLDDGSLLDHDPALMLMKQTTAAYDPTAACPGWESFLQRVMPDEGMRLYLQRIIGYSMTGSMAEQAFFIHHGAGANGKSVMLQVMRAVLGEYAQSVPRDTLLAKKNSEHPTSVARMAGMRFLEVSETAPGKRLDEEMVKGLTGGEKQTARMMGKDFFDFTPTGKIHYVTNHLPRLSDANSIWRRLHLIRWGVTIPKAEQNKQLADELVRDELPGILAWCVRGAQMWAEQGLNPPKGAEGDIEAYREDMDAFGDFLREHTAEQEGALTKTDALYTAYKGWAFGAGINKPMSQQAFTAVMKERGYEYKRRSTGRFFVGLVVTTGQTVTYPWDES